MKRSGLSSLLCLVALAVLVPAALGQDKKLPRLLDLGSKSCIPCQLMAPILDGMKKEFAGTLQVDFVDVGEKANLALAEKYGIRSIPTQVFLDADGKELARHEGFISRYGILAAWKELKYDFAAKAIEPTLVRLEPAKPDTRAKESICFMCDGDLDTKSLVTVKADKGDVRLCSLHCYFVMDSCLTEERVDFEKKVSVTDRATGKPIAAAAAFYLYGMDEQTGRPTIKAFADKAAATTERQAAGGNIVSFTILRSKELADRCGFCDRACYQEDAAKVRVAGIHSWGCCAMCAMGVGARIGGADIEVSQPDALTGEMIVAKSLGGSIAILEPQTAVAWFGMKKNAKGEWGSAGCFHKAFFTSEANLKKWLEQHPRETGKMISIDQALADKLKMTPAQMAKACKIGECAPK